MDRRSLLIGFLCGCAAALVVFLLSSNTAHYEICLTTDGGAKECTTHGVIVFALHEIGAAFDSYSGLITALATAFIAWFTLSLKQATDRLWHAGERQTLASERQSERQLAHLRDSSEMQLRAYVHIEKTPISFSDGVFTVLFSIKNFGQTPAHDVNVRYAFEAVPCVDEEPVRVPIPSEDYFLGSIAPRTDFYVLDAEVKDVSLLSIKEGEVAIYLVGTITYLTVFGKRRETKFQYLVGGGISWDDDDDDREMSADESGNDAS
jgi:hypothetical protein